MNSILKYPGAKWRIAPWIISYMPPHESYLEPYFGSGAVFFNKPKSRIETINDMDGEVVNFFRVCRNNPDELAFALSLTPWAREERNAAYGVAGDDLERARRFAVKCWQSFGAFPQKNRGWRNTTGKMPHGGPENSKLWNRLPDIVHEVAGRLLESQIENRPALEVIHRYDGANVLIYADPPYINSTRTASDNAYNYEMTDTEHEELLKVLVKHKGMILLSGYDSDMYNDLLHDWSKVTMNTTAERGVRRTECLWLNPAVCEANDDGQMRISV